MTAIRLIFLFFLISLTYVKPFVVEIDLDKDGIADSLEQVYAETYAPIIYHDINEKHLPTNVDVFLKETALYIYDDACSPDINRLVKTAPSQSDLISQSFNDNFCGSTGDFFSNCTRSDKKQRTYYLADVSEALKAGSKDTKEWTTYYHCYKNIQRGVTIQYWRFYASDVHHGGDWECVQVFLDNNLKPLFIDMLGHTDIDRKAWSQVQTENNHPIIFSQEGGHSSTLYAGQSGFKQETWTGGKVYHTDGQITDTGLMLNIGEKLNPLNNQVFIKYSGLWGSPGTFYFSSGYWCPPYNETGMNTTSHFIKAWCNDMLDAENRVENGIKECYPCGISR